MLPNWFEKEIDIDILGRVILSARYVIKPYVPLSLEEEGEAGGIEIEEVNLQWKHDNGKDWQYLYIGKTMTQEMYNNILAAIREWQNGLLEPDTDRGLK